MPNIPPANLPPPPGDPVNTSDGDLTLPDSPHFRFPYARLTGQESFDRDLFELQQRVRSIVELNDLTSSFKFRAPLSDPLSEHGLFRTYLEIERVVTKLLQVCCETCRLRIPFPRPFDQSGQIIDWQFTRNLFEIERAINSIQECVGVRDYVSYRADLSTDRHRINSVDAVTGQLGVQRADLPTTLTHAGFAGGWGPYKQKVAGHSSGGGTPFIYTFDMDSLTTDPLTYAVGSLQAFNYLRYVGPDGRYISYLAKNSGVGQFQYLRLIDTTTMTTAWTLFKNDIFGTTGDITGYRFSPDGRWLLITVTGTSAGTYVYDRVTGVQVATYSIDGDHWFSEDGEYLALGAGGTIYVITTSNWTTFSTIAWPAFPIRPYIDPTNTYLAASGNLSSPSRHRVRMFNFPTLSFASSELGISNATADGVRGDWDQTGNMFLIMDNLGSIYTWVNPGTWTPGEIAGSSATDYASLRPFH